MKKTYFTLLIAILFSCNRGQSGSGSKLEITNPSGDPALGTTTGAKNQIGGNNSENVHNQFHKSEELDTAVHNSYIQETTGGVNITTNGTNMSGNNTFQKDVLNQDSIKQNNHSGSTSGTYTTTTSGSNSGSKTKGKGNSINKPKGSSDTNTIKTPGTTQGRMDD